MIGYRKLDAWKVSHQLAVAVCKATDEVADPRAHEILDQLRFAAIRAPAKIAHGWGRRTRRDFQRYVSLASGCLIEVSFYLEEARERGYISGQTWNELDGLRGRATFYSGKLWLSLVLDDEASGGDTPDDQAGTGA